MNVENRKILVITHSYATGTAQKLRDFLISKKIDLLVYLDNPFYFSFKNKSSLSVYRKGNLIKKYSAPSLRGPRIIFFIKDVLIIIYFILRLGENFDICIAADPLNTFSAIILKKISKIKKIVYLTIDYTPRRFINPFYNYIYYILDKFSCYKADCIWNSSSVIPKKREEKGLLINKSAPNLTLVDGHCFDERKLRPINKINRYQVVFMGHLIKKKGAELLIKSFSEVSKGIPESKLVIIGDGPEKNRLKKLTDQYSLEDSIVFTGYVNDEKMSEILSHSALAVAPYLPDPDSYSFYSDVNKPKTYMAAGLPVIITSVPRIAKDIEQKGAGIVIEYKRQQLVNAMMKLLTNDMLYRKYRDKAIEFSKSFRWNDIFEDIFKKTFEEQNVKK